MSNYVEPAAERPKNSANFFRLIKLSDMVPSKNEGNSEFRTHLLLNLFLPVISLRISRLRAAGESISIWGRVRWHLP